MGYLREVSAPRPSEHLPNTTQDSVAVSQLEQDKESAALEPERHDLCFGDSFPQTLDFLADEFFRSDLHSKVLVDDQAMSLIPEPADVVRKYELVPVLMGWPFVVWSDAIVWIEEHEISTRDLFKSGIKQAFTNLGPIDAEEVRWEV